MNFLERLLDKLVREGPNLYVVATGAGAGIQNLLWNKPGASKFLVGASFPYDQTETEDFLGFKADKAVCGKTAIQLAQAAFMRACRGSGTGAPIGLALTAAVATNRERHGTDDSWAACVTLEGTYLLHTPIEYKGEHAREVHGRHCDVAAIELLAHVMEVEDCESVEKVDDRDARDILYDHPVFLEDGRRTRGCKPSVLFAGSFNPLHDGHRGIIENAAATYPLLSVYSLTCDSLHKPPLGPGDILQRASQFKHEDFPLLITRNDALFILKARQFPRTRMVMGVDTLVRVLEPKWFEGVCPEYEDQGFLGVLGMLAEFRKLGTQFDVFDRTVRGKLQTLDDISVPKDYRDLFHRIPLHWDISSTEIRESQK